MCTYFLHVSCSVGKTAVKSSLLTAGHTCRRSDACSHTHPNRHDSSLSGALTAEILYRSYEWTCISLYRAQVQTGKPHVLNGYLRNVKHIPKGEDQVKKQTKKNC